MWLSLTTSTGATVIAMTTFLLSTVSVAREYCQFESFNASCSANQVIVMEEARYGRLQLGRCVTRDYGFIGCSSNVLDLLDRSCSGQQHCSFVIPTLRDLVQPCPKDLTSYLDASYKCVSVLNITRCSTPIQLDSTRPEVYLHSSAMTSSSHQPDVDHADLSSSSIPQTLPLTLTLTLKTSLTLCRVMVRTSPGQQIDFVLFSFGHHFDFEQPSDSVELDVVDQLADTVDADDGDLQRVLGTHCTESIHIIDGNVETSATLCQPRQRRQMLYRTSSSTVWVYFSPTALSDRRRLSYVLKLEAAGCADFTPPVNAWVERFKDRIIVRCNFSQETWYMTCKGTDWIGTVTNCTENMVPINGEITTTNKRRKIPVGLLMAILIGVVLGVTVGLVMLIGILIYRRRQTVNHHVNSKINVLLRSNDNTWTTSEYQPRDLRHCRHGNVCPAHSSGHYVCLPAPPPPPPHASPWQRNETTTLASVYDVTNIDATVEQLPEGTNEVPLSRSRRLGRPSSIALTSRYCVSSDVDFMKAIVGGYDGGYETGTHASSNTNSASTNNIYEPDIVHREHLLETPAREP